MSGATIPSLFIGITFHLHGAGLKEFPFYFDLDAGRVRVVTCNKTYIHIYITHAVVTLVKRERSAAAVTIMTAVDGFFLKRNPAMGTFTGNSYFGGGNVREIRFRALLFCLPFLVTRKGMSHWHEKIHICY